jgi:uncharacterized protein YqgV (UPF0045/DUF77 family)
MDQILSGSVAFYPLGEGQVNLAVLGILDLFEKAGVTYRVGDMTTEFKGPESNVMALLGALVAYAGAHSKYVMDIKLSNTCGL